MNQAGRGRFVVATLTLVALGLLAPCCARPARRPFPTLDQYSAGTAHVVAAFATAFKGIDGAGLASLLSESVGFRPAEDESSPPLVSPSGLRVERYAASDPIRRRGGVVERLLARRTAYQGVVRAEARIASIAGSAAGRTLRVKTVFAGPAAAGGLIQEESWWVWELEHETSLASRPPAEPPASEAAAVWTIASMVEERRTRVIAPEPLLQQVYPDEASEIWQSDSERDEAFESRAIPGAHDTGGVAVIHDCVNGGACLVFASGSSLGVLSRGWMSDAGPFRDRAELVGLTALHGEAKSVVAADFNDDSMPEVLITYDDAPLRLYRGQRVLREIEEEGARIDHLVFSDVTESAGLGGMTGFHRGVAALDADLDGRLDIYVAQYGDRSKSGPSLDGQDGLPNRLLLNRTDPGGPIHFVDASASSGAAGSGWSTGAAAADFDGDGRTDIYVVNSFGPNVLYRNITAPGGPVRFVDRTRRTGTADPSFGMGAAWGDFDGDGDPDLFVTNYGLTERWLVSDPRFPLPPYKLAALKGARAKRALAERISGSTLLRNDGGGRFTPVSSPAGVSDTGWAWGAVWTDIDGDGHLDLAVSNGMLIGERGENREIELLHEISAGWEDFSEGRWTVDFLADGFTGPQPERLLLNLRDGTFTDIAYPAGWNTMADLRGLVAADITGDGAPELIAGAFLDTPLIFENTNAGQPGRIRILLEGTESGRDAVGAVVRVFVGGRIQTRAVSAGGSFLSDCGRILDFGLGSGGVAERVEVRWPSGRESVVDDPRPLRRLLIITEPPPAVATEPAPAP